MSGGGVTVLLVPARTASLSDFLFVWLATMRWLRRDALVVAGGGGGGGGGGNVGSYN